MGHTNAWSIPGTEDLRPCIPAKVHAKEWILTLVVDSAVAAILAEIMALVLRESAEKKSKPLTLWEKSAILISVS